LDTVLPTPNWYGKGLVNNINGKGIVTVTVKVYNQLTAGQSYIFRCWIVAQGQAEAPQGWAYELDRSDGSVNSGSDLEYGTAEDDEVSAGNVMRPVVMFVLFVVALIVL
jgi:hypothetical protein